MEKSKSLEVLPQFDFSRIKNQDVRLKVIHLGEQISVSKNRIGAEFIKICRLVSDVKGLMQGDSEAFADWAMSQGFTKKYALAMARASDRLSSIDDKVLERFSYTAILRIADRAPNEDVIQECVTKASQGHAITAELVDEAAKRLTSKPAPRVNPPTVSTRSIPAPPAPLPLQPTFESTPDQEQSAASPPTDETGQDDAESGSDMENRTEPAAGVFIAEDHPEPDEPAPSLHVDAPPVRDLQSMSVAQKVELDNADLDAFCRKLLKCFDECIPDNPWLIDKGRSASARASVGAACATIRSAKQVCCPACCPEGDIEPDETCAWCRGHGGLPKVLADTIHL